MLPWFRRSMLTQVLLYFWLAVETAASVSSSIATQVLSTSTESGRGHQEPCRPPPVRQQDHRLRTSWLPLQKTGLSGVSPDAGAGRHPCSRSEIARRSNVRDTAHNRAASQCRHPPHTGKPDDLPGTRCHTTPKADRLLICEKPFETRPVEMRSQLCQKPPEEAQLGARRSADLQAPGRRSCLPPSRIHRGPQQSVAAPLPQCQLPALDRPPALGKGLTHQTVEGERGSPYGVSR